MLSLQTFFLKNSKRSWFSFVAIALIALPLLFLYLNGWGFVDPDEGRYGSIPRQMLLRGDFITPTQNYIKFFDKPPLLYWTIAASYSVFGFHVWAARLIPALAALAGLFSVNILGRRMFGPRTGLLSAIVLATSLMWPLLGRVIVTDMLVSSLVFGALVFWWLGHSETLKNRQTVYFLGFWSVLALGVLAKGPIAVVLTGGSLFLYMIMCRQWGAFKSMRWGFGVPLFMLIASPWFVLVALRNPEFNHFFWYDQHIGRFLGNTTGNDHVQNIGYYFKLLPLIMFPWSLFIPAALVAAYHHRRDIVGEKQRAAVFLLCGVAFTLLFFSASSGKIVTYILPVIPLLALLLAAYFDWMLARAASWNRLLLGGVAVLVLLLALCGVAIVVLAPRALNSLDYAHSTIAASLLSFLFVAWALSLAGLSWRFGLRGAIAGTAGGFIAVVTAALPFIATVLPQFTTEPLVQYIQPGLDLTPDAEVLTVNYIHSVEFYTKRRVKMIGIPDEMRFGVTHMPPDARREWVFEGERKLANLREEMKDPHPVYCFVRLPKRAKKYVDTVGNGATIIASNSRFVVFGNPAAVAATPPRKD